MGPAAITMNGAGEWRPAVNPWIIALTVTLATFMEVLDTSIANVALPHIAGGLSAGEDEATWVLTSYLVSNAIVLPLSGWLSNVFGRKRFYMTCVAVFTANYTWRWIFLINVPIGALSLFLTSRLVEDPPYLRGRSRAGIKIDYVG